VEEYGTRMDYFGQPEPAVPWAYGARVVPGPTFYMYGHNTGENVMNGVGLIGTIVVPPPDILEYWADHQVATYNEGQAPGVGWAPARTICVKWHAAGDIVSYNAHATPDTGGAWVYMFPWAQAQADRVLNISQLDTLHMTHMNYEVALRERVDREWNLNHMTRTTRANLMAYYYAILELEQLKMERMTDNLGDLRIRIQQGHFVTTAFPYSGDPQP